MAVFPLQQPPVTPNAERLLIKSNQSVQTSAMSGHQNIVQYYSSWTLELNWPRMVQAKSLVLSGWMDQLQGSLGSFLYTPASGLATVPRSLTLSMQAYVGTNAISVQGFAASATTYLKVGNFFQIGSQLLRVASIPLTADANGKAVIEFNPALRAGYAANQPVITTNPAGTFRQVADAAGSGFQIDTDHVPEFSKLTAMEVI